MNPLPPTMADWWPGRVDVESDKFLPTDNHTTAVVTVIARLRLPRVRSSISGYSSADGAFTVIRYFTNTHFQIEGIVSDQVQPIFNNIARKYRNQISISISFPISPGWHENKKIITIIIHFKNISIVIRFFFFFTFFQPKQIYIYTTACNMMINRWPAHGPIVKRHLAIVRPTDHGPIPYDGSWTHRSTGSDHLFADFVFYPTNDRPTVHQGRNAGKEIIAFRPFSFRIFFVFLVVFLRVTLKIK